MIYSIEDIKAVLSEPVPDDKWGDDTKTVVSIMRSITSASCSSCAFRRHVRRLKDILNKYGDDIKYTPNSYSIVRHNKKIDTSNRIPCTDCVAKHLSQAYILQSEFYQGYTDYLSLIEGHLSEALEECPQHMAELRRCIQDMLASVVVNRKPDIQMVEFTETSASDVRPVNYRDTETHNGDLSVDYSVISGVSSHVLSRVIRLLSTYCTKLDEAITKGPNEFHRYRYLPGYLAQASEFIAPYSPNLADALRSTRLSIPINPHLWDVVYMSETLNKCGEIVESIKDAMDDYDTEKTPQK